MATLTVYSPNTDGRVYSFGTTYAFARTGAGGLTVETTVVRTGQYYLDAAQFYIFEALIKFDTSALSGKTVNSAVLSGYLSADSSTKDFSVQARIHDWGADMTTADWVNADDLSGKTLVATIATLGIGATGAYKAFTSEAAMATNINKTGTTYMILCSSDTVANTAPTGTDEYITFTGGGAGPNAFKLVVDYSEPAGFTGMTVTKLLQG